MHDPTMAIPVPGSLSTRAATRDTATIATATKSVHALNRKLRRCMACSWNPDFWITLHTFLPGDGPVEKFHQSATLHNLEDGSGGPRRRARLGLLIPGVEG
jgi:hypothetical protein